MLFEVVSAPEGASPQWVRDAWVGVQFKALQGAPVSMPTQSAAARSGRVPRIMAQRASGVTERRGYPTKARDVLGLLALHNAEAARWYIDNAPQMLNPDQVFLFDERHCHAITDLR